MEQPIDRLPQAVPHVLLLAVMAFFSMYSRTVLSPLLVPIQEDLGIGPARATSLFIPLSICYSGSMLLSGFAVERLRHRTIIALAIGVLGTGLLVISQSNRFALLQIGFGMIGAGAGLYVPSGVTTVTSIVTDEIRGKAISIHELGPSTSFVVAPLVVTVLSTLGGWRLVPLVSGLSAIVAAFVFTRGGSGGRFYGNRPRLGNVSGLLGQRKFWTIAVFFSLAASSTLGIYAILPTFLVGIRGYDANYVNTLLSLSRISGIGMVFLSGVLVDRFGSARLITSVLAITGVLTIACGTLTGPVLPVVIFAQPVIISAFFPAAISVVADLGSPEMRNVGVSIMIPVVALISNGIFPTIMGALTESGTVSMGFVALGALMILALPFRRLLQNA